MTAKDSGGGGRKFFGARLRNCEKRLLATSCMCVRPSVRMEQLGSHWTNFHDVLYEYFFKSCREKIEVSLKSDNNNGTVLDIQYTF